MLDFNRTSLSTGAVNTAVNDAIERAAVCAADEPRHYLGASIAGGACLRKIQYDWMCQLVHPVRLRDIFARGHFFEEQSRQRLISAGFQFGPATALGFTAINGLLQGHADGVITAGPGIPGVTYPCLWEHKAVNNKGWSALERDGPEKAHPQYATQVALYQAYLDVTNPALFTALNADTCERLHFLVPFNAERAQAWSDRTVTVIEGHRERCWSQP
jgi:hypothetical protein